MSIRTLTALMLALAAAPGTAHAQPACTALGNDPVTGNPLPPPIFITGSTALDPLFYFIRPTDSGTRALIAASIGTTTHNWQGVFQDPVTLKNFGSGDVLSHVSAQSTTGAADKTVGILGEDFYDSGNNRAAVKALAFRAKNQRYAYWPDSTLSSKDKRNVREGRYFIWGYVHILTAVDVGMVPTSLGAKFFVDLMAGTLSAAPARVD